MAQWVVVQGQVSVAKKSKNTPIAAVPPANPKPKTKTVFSISSGRLAESEDGLDSSLAQSGGELQRCKLARAGLKEFACSRLKETHTGVGQLMRRDCRLK